ncbi:GDP-mannose 4,6-dehydratase [Halovenus marina]|uniref:GDP-mannose 4,6-dehydratase n=1 Tax=Halovenus marina TaxID=3396621 RepID=UPI003F57C630
MKRALVTGVAGFIGSHLAAELLDRGYEVRGLDNFDTGSRHNLQSFRANDRFSLTEGDIRDGETIETVTTGVDYLFHEAAVSSVPQSIEDPTTPTDVNCTGTATVLDAARTADVESVVVASSAAVYGSSGSLPKVETEPVDPESPYALSKRYTEELAMQCADLYGIETVALRYFNVFGPRQDPSGAYAAVIPKFIELMADGQRPTIFGDGEQSRDFVSVDDVVDANIRAAERDVSGEICNVARGERTTINELVETINDALGSDKAPKYDEPRPGDIRHSVADIKKARERLGYEPTVSFEAGIERLVRAKSSE